MKLILSLNDGPHVVIKRQLFTCYIGLVDIFDVLAICRLTQGGSVNYTMHNEKTAIF